MKNSYIVPIVGILTLVLLTSCSDTTKAPPVTYTGDTSTATIQTGSAVPESETPTTCTDEDEGMPVITSISTASGSIGTRLTIQGCNFSGFEGDKTAWIENAQGVKGLLRSESGSTSKRLDITLKSPLCQTDTSYNGLPCEKPLTLTPGEYQIYVMPWGKVSNKLDFTITPSDGASAESVSVWAGVTKDVSLTVKDGKWALKIQYGTGARVNVHFNSTGSKTLNVSLKTPKDSTGNIRVSQIVLPDGTMNGPFWRDMTYDLTQSGTYQIILAPNMMAWDPWSWEIDMELELR